jgi:cytochrome c biogenesis protein CcdA
LESLTRARAEESRPLDEEGYDMRSRHWLILVVLLGLLAATVWYGVSVWSATSQMPTYAYVAMVLGAIVMIALGWALMTLMYHSHRSGHDNTLRNDRGDS